MRKSSVQLVTQTSEPLIVVDESIEERRVGGDEDDEHISSGSSESDLQSQLLLAPWRDMRKLSLPSPQCSGITASQVRRLSERGETGGPGPRQTEFLATLSQAAAQTPGGRRHSVVTISKVPAALFGRGRRESAAGLHSLQLDIMDDIVQSRKAHVRLWHTSNEKVCELRDDSGAVRKFTRGTGRRASELIGTSLTPIPSSTKRRSSELPPPPPPLERKLPSPPPSSSSSPALPPPGIVCSNTDLVSLLSRLTTSTTDVTQTASSSGSRAEMRTRFGSKRSSSFDSSILGTSPPSEWVTRKQQSMHRVMWDERSGSVVDAQLLGTAIEEFLRRDAQQNADADIRSKRWLGGGGGGGGGGTNSTLKDFIVK